MVDQGIFTYHLAFGTSRRPDRRGWHPSPRRSSMAVALTPGGREDVTE
jgi:hypothetical protein